MATTKGCRDQCEVKAPLTFQRGAKPRRLTGTFRYDGGKVVITWPAGSETWTPTHGAALTSLALTSNTLGATGGWAYGSTTGFSAGATLDEVIASGVVAGPYWYNAYDASTQRIRDRFPFGDYQRCTGDATLVKSSVNDPDRTKRWNSYLTGDPALDGRKMYWNHQLGVVTEHEAPGSDCISPLEGHTVALLQILDDQGRFQGWVSAEASQHGKYTGGDIVSVAALTRCASARPRRHVRRTASELDHRRDRRHWRPSMPQAARGEDPVSGERLARLAPFEPWASPRT